MNPHPEKQLYSYDDLWYHPCGGCGTEWYESHGPFLFLQDFCLYCRGICMMCGLLPADRSSSTIEDQECWWCARNLRGPLNVLPP